MSLFRSLFRSSASRKAPARRAGQRLRVEGLEDRCLLSASLVADLVPGVDGSNPNRLIWVDGYTYFFATTGGQTRLFRSDGMDTVQVANFGNPPNLSIGVPEYLNGHIYFTQRSGMTPRTYVFDLRKVDLATGVTTLVRSATGLSSGIGNLTVVGDRLAFTRRNPAPPPITGLHIHTVETYDGSQLTTIFTNDAPSGFSINNLTTVGNTLFFGSYIGLTGPRLYKSDGATQATVVSSVLFAPRALASVGGLLYFSATNGTHGRELWVSDGTQIGTRMVADLNPGPADSDPQRIIEGFGTYALFTADDGVSGREPWVCCFDGVTPTQIADLNPGPAGSDPQELLADAAGFLYMSADDGTRGRELWFSDWLPSGTRLVKDIHPGPGSSFPQGLTLLYGYYLYFSADDGVNGIELWASDGSEEFTVLDTDIYPGVGGSVPTDLVELPDGYVYFAATGPDVGRELFRASPFFGGPGGAPGGGAPAAPRREGRPEADLPRRAAEADLVRALSSRKDRREQLFARAIGVLDWLPE